jgi:hypothetical protein
MWTYDLDQRTRMLPLMRDYEKHMESMNNGVYYGYGRDRTMKPITWLNLRKWVDSEMDVSIHLRQNDILSHYYIENGLIPGQVEQWHMIVDMKDVGLTELPVIAFANIAWHMRSVYFARNASLHFIHVPKIVQLVVKYVYTFVDEF